MGNENIKFVPPTAERQKEALGPLEGENRFTQRALSDIEKFWQNIEVRDFSDW